MPVDPELRPKFVGSPVLRALPTAPGLPRIGITHLELDLPDNAGGFRGMGEGGTIGAPAAIANAITDALAPLGIDITELPATPERLFLIVTKSEQKRSTERCTLI